MGAEANIDVTYALPLSRALLQGNGQADTFTALAPTLQDPILPVTLQQPGVGTLTLTPDGVFDWCVLPGTDAAERIFVMPVCEAPAGAAFSMRVWGYKQLPGSGQVQTAWIPLLVAELYCVTCNLCGPAWPNSAEPSRGALLPTERLCDTISLTAGSVGSTGGLSGEIISPQNDTPGYVLLDMRGVQKLAFDFAAVDNLGNPTSTRGMNALWCKA